MELDEPDELDRLAEAADLVASRTDLKKFVGWLAAIADSPPPSFQNRTVYEFLAAAARGLEGAEGYYKNRGIDDVEALSPWRIAADMLIAGAVLD